MTQHLVTGAIIAGKYRLDAQIGEGGHGAVWRGSRPDIARSVAIKFVKASSQLFMRQRFEREAKALGRLSHPNCLTIFDFGHMEDGTAFLVTELVAGQTLRDWIATDPPLAAIVDVARQITGALAYAHGEGIAHRDLKPANVMVTEVNGVLVAKVLDFGLAKMTGEGQPNLTNTGEVFGTFGYMSPEQMRSDSGDGFSSDLYALGVVLYEMLEGRPLFSGDSVIAIAQQHMNDPAPRSTRAPKQLADVVARLLEKDPEDRFATAEQVLEQLSRPEQPRTPELAPTQALATSSGAAARREPDTVDDRAPSWRWFVSVGLVVACVVAFAGWRVYRTKRVKQVRPAEPSLHRVGMALSTPRARAVSADAGAAEVVDRGTPLQFATGCEHMHDLSPGIRPFGTFDGLVHEVVAYIPAGYDRTRRWPAVVMFHDGLQTPEYLIHASGMRELADRDGFVLLAPRDVAISNTWEAKRTQVIAWQDIDAVGENVCLDPHRRYVLGYGEGGIAAEFAPCRGDGVLAVATFAWRLEPHDNPCGGHREPTPFLVLAPTADGLAPVADEEGSRFVKTCIGEKKASLAEHLRVQRKLNRCDGDEAKLPSPDHGDCSTWKCAADLRVCAIEGGRPWPGQVRRLHCAGGATQFPVTTTIWDFFGEHPGPLP